MKHFLSTFDGKAISTILEYRFEESWTGTEGYLVAKMDDGETRIITERDFSEGKYILEEI